MKRSILTILFVVLVFVSPCTALDVSPIYLSHTLIGYTVLADTVELEYALHIENPQDVPLYNAMLSYVPFEVHTADMITLDVGTIEAHGARDITFSMVTFLDPGVDEIYLLPLFWAGEGLDAGGSFVEFPACSDHVPSGGASCQ